MSELVKQHIIEKYGKLFEQSQSLFFFLDFEGNILHANDSVFTLLGYSSEELYHDSIFKIIQSRSKHPLLKILRSSNRRSSVPYRWDDKKITKKGEIVRFQNEASIVNFDHEPTLLLNCMEIHGSLFDRIPRFQRASVFFPKTSLGRKQPSEKFEAHDIVEENFFDIVAKKNMEGRYTYISSSLHRILGFEPNELIKTNYLEYIHPDDRQLAKDFHSFDRDVSVCPILTYRHRHKDGTYRWLESTLSVIYHPESHTPEGYLSVSRDTSERIYTEMLLKESGQQYRRLVENSLDTIAVIRSDKWAFVNQTGVRLFEVDHQKALLGRSIYDFLHLDDHQSFKKIIFDVLHHGLISGLVELEWHTLHGKRIHTEIVAVPITYEEEPALQVIIRDISERKQSEQLMLQSEKLSAVGQLAAGIAHEIRNPLTSIKGFLQLIETGYSEKKEYYDIMKSELNRIESILSELLILSKPHALSFKRSNFTKLLLNVITLLESHANMNSVEIHTYFEGTEIWVECDANQMKQVFINLIKNAIEAMPMGGEIKLRAKIQEGMILVDIQDQGEGIPEEKLIQIGQPFYSTKEKGTGLGLMVSYQIIANHRGNISITSKLNEGTTFTVQLPISQQG